MRSRAVSLPLACCAAMRSLAAKTGARSSGVEAGEDLLHRWARNFRVASA